MKHVYRGTAAGLASAAATINQAIGWRRYQLDDEEPGLLDWFDAVEQSFRPAIPVLTSPGLWIEGAEYCLKLIHDDLWRVSTPAAVYDFPGRQAPAALAKYAEVLAAVADLTDNPLTRKEAEAASLLADWLKIDHH